MCVKILTYFFSAHRLGHNQAGGCNAQDQDLLRGSQAGARHEQNPYFLLEGHHGPHQDLLLGDQDFLPNNRLNQDLLPGGHHGLDQDYNVEEDVNLNDIWDDELGEYLGPDGHGPDAG